MPGTPAAQCDYDVVVVAMNTSLGTQDIVGDCGGKTPKGGVIIASRVSGALGNTPVNGAMLSISVWDASGNSRLVACMSENGVAVASADSGRQQSSSALVLELDTTSEAITGTATFSAVSANTLTIDVTDAPVLGILLEVWFFYGDTMQCHVGDLACSAIIGTEVTETGIPFKPRALIAIGAVAGFSTTGANARHTMGFCAFNDDDTIQGQCGISGYDRDAPATVTRDGGGFRTDSIIQRLTIDGTGAVLDDSHFEVTGLTADGFKVTTRADAESITLGYLALFTGKLRAWVDNPSLGLTSIGFKSITDPGFRPRFLACIGSRQTTENVYVTDSQSLHFGVGAAVSDSQMSACYHCQDQSSPNSATRSLSDFTLMSIYTTVGGGAVDYSVTLTSFDSTGFTVIVLPASGANRQVGFLALEDGSAPGWFDARSGHRWRRQLARM